MKRVYFWSKRSAAVLIEFVIVMAVAWRSAFGFFG